MLEEMEPEEFNNDLNHFLAGYLVSNKVSPSVTWAPFSGRHNYARARDAVGSFLNRLNHDVNIRYYSRILIPLNLGDNLGFAAVDLKSNTVVLGECTGDQKYESRLLAYEKMLRNNFKNCQIKRVNLNSQTTDRYVNAQLSFKMLGLLGTAKSLSDPLQPHILSDFKMNGAKENSITQEMYQKASLWKSGYTNIRESIVGDVDNVPTNDVAEPTLKPLLQKMQIVVDDESPIYPFLVDNIYQLGGPIIVSLLDAYNSAPEAVQQKFRELILTALENNFTQPDQFRTNFLKLVPALTQNYNPKTNIAAKKEEKKSATATVEVPFTKSPQVSKLINRFTEKGYEVSIDAHNAIKIKKIGAEKQDNIEINKISEDKLELKATFRDQDTLNELADAIEKCVDKETPLKIHITGGNSEAERVAARNKLWLNSVNKGYEISNYTPSEEWLKDNQDKLQDDVRQKYLPATKLGFS